MAKRTEAKRLTPVPARNTPSEVPPSVTRLTAVRRATVEIDRVTGMPPPPKKVKGRTLESIFGEAGLELTVKHGDTKLPDRPKGFFAPPDLHQAMKNHRDPNRSGWHAHVLIVPSIEIPHGDGPSTSLLGLMYDDRGVDSQHGFREGCAISATDIAEEDDQQGSVFLHTLAHELGHVFNLQHTLPADHTLMNTTHNLKFGNMGHYPDNIEFAFNDDDKYWLEHAPEDQVRPGGAPSRSPDTFNTRGNGVTPDLKLLLSKPWPSYEVGDPVHVQVRLRNDSAEPIRVSPILSTWSGNVGIQITPPTGRSFRFKPLFRGCFRDHPAILQPGREFSATEPLFYGARGHTFKKPGKYQVRAQFRTMVEGVSRVAFSDPLEIVVKPSREKTPLLSPGAASFLVMNGGSHLKGAREALELLSGRTDRPQAVQYARLALAADSLRPGSVDRARAKRYLGAVDPASLDRSQQAQCLSLRAAASAQDRNPCLRDFEALVRENLGESAGPYIERTKAWVERSSRNK